VQVEAKLHEMGLELPAPIKVPPGFTIPFSWTRVRGNRMYISGHAPLEADGTYSGPSGKVPSEVSLEEAQQVARKVALAMLSSVKRELGDLDRVTAWLMINGMVNANPGYPQTTLAINGFSELILELYGPEIGQHARTAVGMAALPFNSPIIVAAEVEFE
jgi:enamine deaminase RidA (YjgF/YER057c/UK114 family)